MPYNDNVDSGSNRRCVEVFPTHEDYFRYYPEMKTPLEKTLNAVNSKVSVSQFINNIIGNHEKLHEVFMDWCDAHSEIIDAETMLKGHARLLHTVVCNMIGITNKTGLPLRGKE